MKPLLLGEAPSRRGDRYHRFPLSGTPAKTLCKCADLPPDGDAADIGSWTWGLYEHFETLNTIERYADAYPWSSVRAQERWKAFVEDRGPRPLIVVALGRKAADAIGISGRPWGFWVEAGLTQKVVAPHPSGRNRLMNEDANREMLGRILREALDRAHRIPED